MSTIKRLRLLFALLVFVIFSFFWNSNFAHAINYGLDYRIPAHFCLADELGPGTCARQPSTAVIFDNPPYTNKDVEKVNSFRLGTSPGDGSYFQSNGGSGVYLGSFDAPGNITQAGTVFLTVYNFNDYVNPIGYVEFFCTDPVSAAGDCVIINPSPPPACTTHCFSESISASPFNLYYPIPAHFGPNGTQLLCDVPIYSNENFGSYRIGISPGDDSYFGGNTFGTGGCTGHFDAPGNIIYPGVNYLTLYINTDFTAPYGFVEFFCTTPVSSAGDCVINSLTPSSPPAVCTTDCFSNVLFFPGLMGSRLYEPGLECGGVVTGSECEDKELWFSLSDFFHEKLSLNTQGKSINNIVTKNDTQNNGELDETGIVDDTVSFNMYQSFIHDLRKWKEDDKIIKDYAFIPYDWRLSLDDVITNGHASENGNLSYTNTQDFSESFILKKLEALQNSSKSGKVTIIGHSNGGLVAKALIQKLKDTGNPLYDKIDRVILVAVPQVGTPDAIAALLHGKSLGHGLIMNQDRSRQISENMPSIYNLLPSAGYFSAVDPGFAVDQLASFENKPFFNPQTSQYGVYISNETELKNYVLGTDGRIKPPFDDTVHPNIGNNALYTEAQSVHQMLDSWQPSPNTKVIQVAGWGEETIAGLDYKLYKNFFGSEYLSYKPRYVVDGDSTVLVPSALWMSESPNVERWWVDLKAYDTIFTLEREHRDILEVSNLRTFMKSKIMNSAFSDQNNVLVNNTSTLASSATRLHYTLHSPLTLGIKDAQGRYTGLDPVTGEIKEEIPDVRYEQIGDVQFISAPADVAYTLEMKGYEEGSFSLDVDKQEGNNVTASTSFQGIPSSTSTIATMNITPNIEVSNSTLVIDQNGDGAVDKTLNATSGGVTVYDITPPELKITFDINTKDVVLSAIDILDQNPTITTTKEMITLKDNSGNTTAIPLKKFRDLPTRLRLTYNEVIRNGVKTKVSDTNIVYDWQGKKGVLTDLDTRIVIKGEEKYIFNYKKAKNITTVKEKIGKDVKTKTVDGFVVATVQTKSDGLGVHY